MTIFATSYFLLDTCTCSTPSSGTSGNNEIKCSNGETRFCEANEECYATEKFNYGKWSAACRVPAGTSGIHDVLDIFTKFLTLNNTSKQVK